MKALVLTDYNKLEYKEVDEPKVGDDDVLVKVKACGICGSDVHGMDGSTGRRQPPVIMGHEASGIIAEVGSNVSGWEKGARVTFDSTVYCGRCGFCKEGRINLCDNRMVLGVSCDDYRRDGAFAEYVAVPQHILYALEDNVTFSQAAMVEAVSIAFHAVERAPIPADSSAVVVGAGMIGLLVVQILKAKGCEKIIAVDIDEDRLKLAGELGAETTLKADGNDVVQKILSVTGPRGADVAFEVVGISESLQTAIGGLRKGGAVVLVGNIRPTVELGLQSVVTGEITLYGSCASSGEYPACLEMIAKGKINVDALISAEADLAEGAQWFKRLYNKEKGLMKVILRA
jgi:L-iditol 2-dehydrogenase